MSGSPSRRDRYTATSATDGFAVSHYRFRTAPQPVAPVENVRPEFKLHRYARTADHCHSTDSERDAATAILRLEYVLSPSHALMHHQTIDQR
jgi:hypothetical protein